MIRGIVIGFVIAVLVMVVIIRWRIGRAARKGRRGKRWWMPGRRTVLDEQKMVTRLDGLLDELQRRPRIISRDSLQAIADTLTSANITGARARRDHTAYARHTSAEVSAAIAHGQCPRCGRQLVIRKSAGKEFAGCSGYPNCRFTCSIDRLSH